MTGTINQLLQTLAPKKIFTIKKGQKLFTKYMANDD